SFLLVHDDIIDRAHTRRGGKALHYALQDEYFGSTQLPTIGVDEAIIFGDIMCFHGFELVNGANLTEQTKTSLLSIMTRTYEMTAWGQALDIYHTKPKLIDSADRVPLSISEFKTAYYTISNPYIMGMILSGNDSVDERKAIESFALPLGIAFQLRDDLLGVFGKELSIGKSSDSDLVEGKYTMLVQKTAELLSDRDRTDFVRIIGTPTERITEGDVERLRNYIVDSGAKEIVRTHISELTGDAIAHIEKMNVSSSSKDVLRNIVDLINKVDV
ncbi:MAG TPA: polyprenyl synthetase family protein, partial [Spirochaetota bacterium]